MAKCEVCQKETNLCKCPKTESEAEQIAKKTGLVNNKKRIL